MSADRQTSGLGFTGQSVKRVEDERLLVGKGEFVADRMPENGLHAVFVRSPFPHATIDAIDVTAARQLDGVAAVYTGAELNALTNAFPPFQMLPGLYTPLYKCLSDDKVRHAGDPVAVIVAESRHVAEDAVELVEVDYTELPAVASIADAVSSSETQVWEKADGNLLWDKSYSFGSVDEAFARADRVISHKFDCQRQSNQPMETRGIVVEKDTTGHLTITSTTQAPHFLKWAAAALTTTVSKRAAIKAIATNKERRAGFLAGAKSFLGENKDSLADADNSGMVSQLKKDRSMLGHMATMGLGLLAEPDFPTVRAVDIGGAFGSKGPVSREEIAVIAVAKQLDRPVQWIEDRVENLLDGGQAREESFTMTMAVDHDGTVRGLKADCVLDAGAYPAFPIGSILTPLLWKVYLPGSYRFEAFEIRARLATTNKGKIVPYRGPWANETWARERMMDVVAAELGVDPGEFRRKNMFGPEHMPTAMVTGPTLDETMSVRATLEEAMRHIDADELAAAKVDAEARGHRLGLGIASYHEAAPGPPNFFTSVNPGNDGLTYEDGRATVEADGRIVVYTSQSPHGQSHVTTYKQVTADEFGVAMEDVDVVWGDTDRTQFSFLGTGGSRGGPLGAGVLRTTSRDVRQQVVDKAAEMLEADPNDIDIVNGNIHVAGVPARGIGYSDVAQAQASATGVSSGAVFEKAVQYRGVGNGGWSVATHVAWVDVDLETGMVEIPRYLVVEDCGPIINPAVVDGQVRGGVAQGVGAVFYENLHYDDQANIQATTYMDYLIPTSMEIPEVDIVHLETLTDGENDARGVGEGGMIGAPAALTNAVSDALGVQVGEQHLPPTRILELAGVIEPD